LYISWQSTYSRIKSKIRKSKF